jgi:hypothetical protein
MASPYVTAAKKLTRIYVSLGQTAKAEPTDGYVPNQWGTYWSADLVEQWFSANEFFCQLEDDDERTAAVYSKAMLLISLNRLDEAEAELARMAREPDASTRKALAVVMARRGRVAEAKALALLNERDKDPRSRSFRMSDDEVLREVEIGKHFQTDATRTPPRRGA